jgi:hypothetical protein
VNVFEGPLGFHLGDALAPPQQPADAGVVMTTVLRPCITDAIQSVYRQEGAGRIHLLVGVDVRQYPIDPVVTAARARPPNVSFTLLTLPWSTSRRHGGVHTTIDGGSMRSILSLAANARHVAYLDDDNTWTPDHLASLLAAVRGKAWAHSMRRLVDATDGADLGLDVWDSVGVGKGRFAAEGGFVDTTACWSTRSSAAMR